MSIFTIQLAVELSPNELSVSIMWLARRTRLSRLKIIIFMVYMTVTLSREQFHFRSSVMKVDI